MADLDDALQRARAGDADGFAALYKALAGPLLGFLTAQVRSREDAQDLLGEVFMAALRDIERIEGDVSGFRAWLYRVATNRAIDLARRAGRRAEGPLGEDLLVQEGPEEEVAASERRRALWQAVWDLPEEQRLVVSMRLAGDLTAPEIARIVGKSPGAVKALQHRALVNLAKALKPYPEGPSERLEQG